MSKELILGIDPGETIGLCLLQAGENPLVKSWAQVKVFEGDEMKFDVLNELISQYVIASMATELAIEDFRLYANRAAAQSGQRMNTARLIGYLEYQAYDIGLPLTKYPASKKGRWPAARLENKVPSYGEVTTPHALDALMIALVHFEALDYQLHAPVGVNRQFLVLDYAGKPIFFDDRETAEAYKYKFPKNVYTKIEDVKEILDGDVLLDPSLERANRLRISPERRSAIYYNGTMSGVLPIEDLEYFFGHCEVWR